MARDVNGMLGIHLAAMNGNCDIINFLIQHEKDMKMKFMPFINHYLMRRAKEEMIDAEDSEVIIFNSTFPSYTFNPEVQ